MSELFDDMREELKRLKREFKDGVLKYEPPPLTEKEKLEGLVMMEMMAKLYTHVYNYIHERKLGSPNDIIKWGEEYPTDIRRFVAECCKIIGYYSPIKED